VWQALCVPARWCRQGVADLRGAQRVVGTRQRTPSARGCRPTESTSTVSWASVAREA